MLISTTANVLTCRACTHGLNEGLQVAFKSGSIMGLTVVGLGMFGMSSLFLIFTLSGSNYEETFV